MTAKSRRSEVTQPLITVDSFWLVLYWCKHKDWCTNCIPNTTDLIRNAGRFHVAICLYAEPDVPQDLALCYLWSETERVFRRAVLGQKVSAHLGTQKKRRSNLNRAQVSPAQRVLSKSKASAAYIGNCTLLESSAYTSWCNCETSKTLLTSNGGRVGRFSGLNPADSVGLPVWPTWWASGHWHIAASCHTIIYANERFQLPADHIDTTWFAYRQSMNFICKLVLGVIFWRIRPRRTRYSIHFRGGGNENNQSKKF